MTTLIGIYILVKVAISLTVVYYVTKLEREGGYEDVSSTMYNDNPGKFMYSSNDDKIGG